MSTLTVTRSPTPQRPTQPCPAERPTHVGIELRLTLPEAGALEMFLGRFADLIESRVMSCPGDTREPLLAAIAKLTDRLGERCPPFDDA